MIDDEEIENRRKWHVKREISLGDLVAVTTALVAVVISYAQLDARVKLVEVLTGQNAAQIAGTVTEIKSDMRRLADRIERIVEKQNDLHQNGNGLRR